MATVPTVDAPNVSPSGMPGVRQNVDATAADFGGIQAAQEDTLGKATLGAGNELARIDYYQQNIANRNRIDDAKNQLRAAALDLQFGDSGYLQQKGATALAPRDDGSSLPDYYSGKLQQQQQQIAGTLSNPLQQAAFARESSDILTAFKGHAQAHVAQEATHFGVTTQQAGIKTAADTAIANYDNPDIVKQNIESAIGARIKLDQLQGNGGIAQNAKSVASAIHLGVIDEAIKAGNIGYAADYFKDHRESTPTNVMGMTGQDVMKAQDALRKTTDGQVALGAVSTASKSLDGGFNPSPVDRITGIVAPAYGGTGGTAQLKSYMDTLVQKYGDPYKAMAVVAVSPKEAPTGNTNDVVDAAVKAAKDAGTPDAWANFLPKQSQADYKAMATKYDAGVGTPPMPTKLDFVNSSLNALPPGASASVINLTRERAEQQYGLITADRKEKGEQIEKQAQQALIANGGDFVGLDPGLKSQLARFDPQLYNRVQNYAGDVSKPRTQTNQAAYNAAVTYPGEMAKMTDAQFEVFSKANFAPEQARHVAQVRADLLSGKTQDSAESLNNVAVNTVLQARLNDLGIDGKPKPTDTKGNARVGAIQMFVRSDLYQQQQQLGRKMMPEEIEKRVNNLFTQSVDLPGIIYGTNNTNMLGMKVGDIPRADSTAIKSGFAAKGIQNPTDTQLLNAYWNKKNAR